MSRTAKEIETTGLPCEAQNGETIQVVPKIDVTMFGKFTLKQEGMEVPHAVSLTGRSRRLWTLTGIPYSEQKPRCFRTGSSLICCGRSRKR